MRSVRVSPDSARAILQALTEGPITRTAQLAELIAKAGPGREPGKHPATRSFQAIRIFINEELQALEEGLQAAVSVLAVAGRLAVISFHSLEDRIVKRFMRTITKPPALPAGLPVMHQDQLVPFRLVGKSRVPGEEEITRNPRARSARLRVLERVL